MRRRPTPAPRSGALEAGQTKFAGDTGSADAVLVIDDITPSHAASRMKASIVDILAELVSIDPALAAAWSHVVEALWPGWREL